MGDIQRDLFRKVLERIDDYKMPIIKLDRENTREAICLVFEKVNVGGKKLDAFELLTAIYAADTFDLRRDWSGDKTEPGRRTRMIGSPNRRDVLAEIRSTDFLQTCTLLHTRELRMAKEADGFKDKDLPQISCKRDALLALPLPAYRRHAAGVEEGFVDAATFLNELKIIWYKDIPYPPQVVGLAAVFAILAKEAQSAKVKEQLRRWFWCVTLGELYGSATEGKLARDVPELVEWVRGSGPQPRSIDEAIFQKDRLNSLRSRLAAAYKGIHALVMGAGCQDFITGEPTDIMTFFNNQIDIHHIFPQAWCKKQGVEAARFDSIINKTPLSKRSNIVIGGDAPSVYLRRIEPQHGISSETLDGILRTHLIEPALLRADDFDGFMEARGRALAGLVAGAMGKPVVEDQGADEEEQPPSAVEEAEEERDLELVS